MPQLPEYLNAHWNAQPRAENTVAVGDDIRITVLTPCLLRIEQGTPNDAATQKVICRDLGPCAFETREEGDAVTVSTSELTLTVRAGAPLSPETLCIRRLRKPCFVWQYGDKPLMNLGGTVCTLDEVNGACPLEDGVCSLDGYALMDDSGTPVFTGDGWLTARSGGTDLYFFGHGHNYTDAVKDYLRLTGVPDMLPAYALGNWWCRWHRYTADEYLELMDRFHGKDVPLSVAVVDMDWHLTQVLSDDRHDGWTGYTWNEAYFPDYRDFLRQLHRRGLHTSLNLHPAQGVRSYEKMYPEMAQAMGRPADGRIIYFNCLDPQFLKAYFEVLHFPYEKDGVDFWWMDWQQGNDYREICMEDYKPSDIESITPLWMLNHMHYLASRREGKRAMFFSRYAGNGSQRYGIGFSGDTVITWESLAFQPAFTATASNIGYSRWSHDIGGHMRGYKDDELAVRWIQLGVFSPILRLHSNDNPFLGREPWSYQPHSDQLISDLLRLRHRLFPYLYTMDRRSVTELLPLVRPMYHVSPEEKDAYTVPNEYWFGSEMIVAPVTRKANAESMLAPVEVWLPEGTWTDWQTGYVYYGKQKLTMLRPVEQLPVLLKAGAIVPLQAHTAFDNTLGGAQRLELAVAPGADGRFVLYEDDGVSACGGEAPHCLTTYEMKWGNKRAELTISPVEGDVSLVPQQRGYTLTFCGFARGCAFACDGVPLEAAYDAARARYTVQLTYVAGDRGAHITVHNDNGLLHDDSDCLDRLMPMMIRAQGKLEPKDALYARLCDALDRIGRGQGIDANFFSRNAGNGLSDACLELVSQLQRRPGHELIGADSAKMTIHKA